MTEKLNCKRCGYEWTPRKKEPKKCPNCYSRKWRDPIPADWISRVEVATH